jgi:hypothetical protein
MPFGNLSQPSALNISTIKALSIGGLIAFAFGSLRILYGRCPGDILFAAAEIKIRGIKKLEI